MVDKVLTAWQEEEAGREEEFSLTMKRWKHCCPQSGRRKFHWSHGYLLFNMIAHIDSRQASGTGSRQGTLVFLKRVCSEWGVGVSVIDGREGTKRAEGTCWVLRGSV